MNENTSFGGALLYDAHMHLYDPVLLAALDQDKQELPLPKIAIQVVNGTHPDNWSRIATLLSPHGTRLYKAYGVHPWRVKDLPPDWEKQLRAHLQEDACSVGEIGLDNWIEPRDEKLQMDIFERQLHIAHELDLSPTIHCVRAWGLLLDSLKRGPDFSHGFLSHGFGGSVEVMHQLADMGAYFSFSAYPADPGRKKMRDAVRACPADRLLVETDSPDMVPPESACRYPLRDAEGQRLHHPAELATAYRLIAEWRGEGPQALAEQVEVNFYRLFRPNPNLKAQGAD